MSGLDDAIADLGHGSVLLALLAALLLGLRHATDPDHLTAVSTLVLSDEPERLVALLATLSLCSASGTRPARSDDQATGSGLSWKACATCSSA